MMKIAYFINTFKSINWGGQATSSGIKYMIEKNYPNAEFIPMDMPSLPFKKVKILRKYYEYKIIKAIKEDELSTLVDALKQMNISEDIFESYTHILFNGEGAIHYKSGHIILFMGLLYLAKAQGKVVVSINQTVDLNNNISLKMILSKVYNQLDFVSVREPISYEYLQKLGVKNVELIPDAVYGLPKMDKREIEQRVMPYNLPKEFITFTGSSALKRNKSSLVKVKKILSLLNDKIELPIVFMANAKTDIWLAHKLQKEFDFIIIEPPVTYQDAMAIIAKSSLLIGGRQHPNIFAYIYKTPYIPFVGNTFKNEGVAQLQNYPIKPLMWDINGSVLVDRLNKVNNTKFLFKKDINIKDFYIFN